MERSDFAPVSWRRDQTEAGVRKIILKHGPDFVFFQEFSGMVPLVETHGMVPAKPNGRIGDLAILAEYTLLEGATARFMKNAELVTLARVAVT